MTAAVRAGGLFHVMLRDGQSLRECLLAGVAEEIIVGHTNLPHSLDAYDCRPVVGRIQISPHAFRAANSTYTVAYGAGDSHKTTCTQLLNCQVNLSSPDWKGLPVIEAHFLQPPLPNSASWLDQRTREDELAVCFLTYPACLNTSAMSFKTDVSSIVAGIL